MGRWADMQRTTLIEQRKALLQAVRVLTNNGHHALAQQLWDASSSLDHRRVLLPGERH